MSKARNALQSPEMRPTPRNKVMGALADGLMKAQAWANQAQIPQGVPLLGGQGVGDMLLDQLPQELNEWSYGNMPVRVNPLAGQTAGYMPETKPGRQRGLAAALTMTPFKAPRNALMAAGGMVDPNMSHAATVWHGSPHKFDKFDSSKIGTGEGAQAYGHGLYLADSQKVATEYSKITNAGGSFPSPVRLFKGVELQPGTPEYHAGTLLEHSTLSKARKDVAKWIADGSPDPRLVEGWKKTLDTLNQATSKADFKLGPSGNLYKVDLPDEKIARMLDWDAPLSQQAPEVQKALEPILRKSIKPYKAVDGSTRYMATIHGQQRPYKSEADALQALSSELDGATAYLLSGEGPQSSNLLTGHGIPGIRYLDGGSRGAGAGTRNYVVFPGEEDALRILERNGQGLLGP